MAAPAKHNHDAATAGVITPLAGLPDPGAAAHNWVKHAGRVDFEHCGNNARTKETLSHCERFDTTRRDHD